MEELLNQLMSSFNIKLMISITILSYSILKVIEILKLKTSKVIKKIITLIISLILCIVYYTFLKISLDEIIPTYLISVAFYDIIMKFILEKLNIGYKK